MKKRTLAITSYLMTTEGQNDITKTRVSKSNESAQENRKVVRDALLKIEEKLLDKTPKTETK